MKNEETLKRLKIVEGHMRGVIRMMDEGAYCIDVIRPDSGGAGGTEQSQRGHP